MHSSCLEECCKTSWRLLLNRVAQSCKTHLAQRLARAEERWGSQIQLVDHLHQGACVEPGGEIKLKLVFQLMKCVSKAYILTFQFNNSSRYHTKYNKNSQFISFF
jgi:hypothetical protein